MSEKTIAEKLTEIAENVSAVFMAGGGGSADNDYELIDDVTLTEDVATVSFTQDRNGNPLTNYKDFFLYFCGSFTADESKAIYIRGNNGGHYFMWNTFSKTTTWKGFWHSIEEHEITDGDGNTRVLFKSTYPASLLGNMNNGAINTQGLADNNNNLKSDLTVGIDDAKVSSYDISSQGESVFATGSRFLLFGRRR